ncbi:glycoside hydrolase family 43 protein [Myceligenerans pegani]|uniref:Glycoside hydrolase family 43 protein n=1 Tax=Myceligenerans pegani TaxID=2776917 RepID=A0ABR9N781_9MICO|nr:glycoside hydrolase family 43 protein [Myceligenerans sp. TRM 65318]MBE1879024.1 glycoside hydrolase family 43 protein [Myceligenerans sp. TRM 65318]MBE3021295.1 glycoside hydrolase family 43 protein [Myceligenerans sp. TRM 65318]
MTTTEPADAYGYLFVHFFDEPGGESIYLSLSDGDTPLRWRPLAGGRPVLRSDVGTRGVRDPVLARDQAGRFHILATDLNVESGQGGWDQWVRHGSRSLVLWDSDDLVTWSGPRLVEVAPPEAGMAWAPEVVTDPDTGDRVVFWSSRLYDPDDVDHAGDSYSRILCSRTRDFETFTPAEVLIDTGRDIIDTAILFEGDVVHRVSKDEDDGEHSPAIHHEVGGSLFAGDYRTVATRVAAEHFARIEAPILLSDPRAGKWYLFLDQYAQLPQGYFVMETDDIAAGRWTRVPPDEIVLRPGTKHGGILPLRLPEWERLDGMTQGATL